MTSLFLFVQFIFDAAITYCFDLAKDRYGCCVLQKCIFHSSGEKRRQLISAVISNALCLSQDQYGYSLECYCLDGFSHLVICDQFFVLFFIVLA